MKCKNAKLCGGCPLLAIPYEKQAAVKREKVVKLLENAHLRITLGQIHMAKAPSYYRNKVIVAFGKDSQKHVYAGLYAPKSHRVVNTSGCAMQPKIVNEIIDTIAHLVESMKIMIYNPKTHTGLLRHVLIRYAEKTDQIMVVFVTSQRDFPSRRNMVNVLREKFPQITTILQSVNDRDTSVVLENDCFPLYGNGMITDELCGLKISFSPSSFYQINHDQCEVLYNLAKEMLELKDTDTLLDTYCGVGTIGLFMADSCKQVTGVEINREAVANANYNAKANGIKNIRFVAMDSTRYMSEAKRMRQHYNAIILDPPRAGTTPLFIENACALKPDKILYISCDPQTQIRDLRLFKMNGYVTDKMELVDMFPNTEHLESLVVLTPSKQTPKSYPRKTGPAKGAGRAGSYPRKGGQKSYAGRSSARPSSKKYR